MWLHRSLSWGEADHCGSVSYKGCWPTGLLSQFPGQLAAGLCGVGGVPAAGAGGVGGAGQVLGSGLDTAWFLSLLALVPISKLEGELQNGAC